MRFIFKLKVEVRRVRTSPGYTLVNYCLCYISKGVLCDLLFCEPLLHVTYQQVAIPGTNVIGPFFSYVSITYLCSPYIFMFFLFVTIRFCGFLLLFVSQVWVSLLFKIVLIALQNFNIKFYLNIHLS